MSCTIGAIPFLLIYGAVAALTSASVMSSSERSSIEDLDSFYSIGIVKNSFETSIKDALKENNGEVTPEMIEMICKEYQTVFMDKELLQKTLREYGFGDFVFDNDKIKCELEGFIFSFERENECNPYSLKVSCGQNSDDSVIVADLNNEYGLNTQEETYIKIKERLSNKNLKIDEEEILEDDSIMLTINLD